MEKESLVELIDSKVRQSIYYDPKAISIKGSKKDKRYEISFFKVGVLKIIESTSPVTYKVRNLILDMNKDNEIFKLFLGEKEWSDSITLEEMNLIFESITKLFDNCFLGQNYGTFSCCSRYKACSEAKKCVHPNQLIAEGCSYKNNLKNGNIYF